MAETKKLKIATPFRMADKDGVERTYGVGEQDVPAEIADTSFVQAHTEEGAKKAPPPPGSEADHLQQFEGRAITPEDEASRMFGATNPGQAGMPALASGPAEDQVRSLAGEPDTGPSPQPTVDAAKLEQAQAELKAATTATSEAQARLAAANQAASEATARADTAVQQHAQAKAEIDAKVIALQAELESVTKQLDEATKPGVKQGGGR